MSTVTDTASTDQPPRVLLTRTRRTYAADWALFTDWCAATDTTTLPTDPRTVVDFLTGCPAAPATQWRVRPVTSETSPTPKPSPPSHGSPAATFALQRLFAQIAHILRINELAASTGAFFYGERGQTPARRTRPCRRQAASRSLRSGEHCHPYYRGDPARRPRQRHRTHRRLRSQIASLEAILGR